MKSKKYHWVVLIIASIITLFFNNVLIQYANEFTDVFAILINSSSNVGGVIMASFLFYICSKKKISFYLLVVSAILGFIGYELLQIIMPWQTFDIMDVYGSVVGGIIACILQLPYVFLIQNRTAKS